MNVVVGLLSEIEVWALLLTWRRDIESVPFPMLLTTDTALAVLADARELRASSPGYG